jgi:hypothetical protein
MIGPLLLMFLALECRHLCLARIEGSRLPFIGHKSSFVAAKGALTRGEEAHVDVARLTTVLSLRGGEVISRGKKHKKTGALGAAKETFMAISPSTRRYLSLCLFCTVVHCSGLPAPTMFNLDRARLWEVWRPFTAVSYFGAPSMSMASSMYFLVRYGQTLETEFGTGVHTWFLLCQVAILTVLGLGIGFPFMAQSMISAAVYVCSHLRPLEQMPFQFGLTIVSWQLPFCMMGIDCLSQQSAAAAWPHLLGIFSGHCYHFFTKVWPGMGGRAWLQTPAWFERRFGVKRASNVAGIDFRSRKEAAMKGGKGRNKAGALRRKKGQGNKLGAGAPRTLATPAPAPASASAPVWIASKSSNKKSSGKGKGRGKKAGT